MSMARLMIKTKEKGASIGDLYGIFFEDINHAADGGLYGELVRNRSFEFDAVDHPDYDGLTAWEELDCTGKEHLSVATDRPLNERNPHYMTADFTGMTGGGRRGVVNRGYGSGIPVKKGAVYLFSCYVRPAALLRNPIRVTIETAAGERLASAEICPSGTGWQHCESELTAAADCFTARLVLSTLEPIRFDLDMVSLFPAETFRNRKNGLRRDIAQMLADLKPKFVRFPGGCLVHDGTLDADDRQSMYRWKNTLGPIEQRPSRRNNWGYNQSLGLGFYEYFQFCEDIGAKPLPVLPGAYDPHHQRIVPLDQLGPWIDDALDLIEFALGSPETTWGGIRSRLGHPQPFNLEYIAIGNEEVGAPFFERYPYFHRAIKERYPHIKVINSSGPFAAGGEYERGWQSARENGSDLVDEHYYQAPDWFLANYHRYDSFPADGPKVFLGEYASKGNTYYNALVEAAYMTGLERNAHAVGLACYAPLLAHADYVNWSPDLIWFNNHAVFGSASYYVQKLFMNNQGDQLLRVQASGLPAAEKPEKRTIGGKVALRSRRTIIHYHDFTIIDLESGEETNYGDGTFGSAEADESIEFATIQSNRYTVRFDLQKIGGLDNKGAVLDFNKQDDRHMFGWQIGGWDNKDSIIQSLVAGQDSVLTQSTFSVEKGKTYHLELTVDGAQICTKIDGVTVNRTEDKPAVIEPLYYTASEEKKTGDIIVKAVNVRSEALETELVLEGAAAACRRVMVGQLAGYRRDDENSFSEPKKIYPATWEKKIKNDALRFTFPPESVTVLRFKQ